MTACALAGLGPVGVTAKPIRERIGVLALVDLRITPGGAARRPVRIAQQDLRLSLYHWAMSLTKTSIRPLRDGENDALLGIINEAAQRYRGVIPDDCWHDPYFSAEYLASEIAAGVRFSGYEADGELLGAMGVQDVDDVTLIRHAYVLPRAQRSGIGGELLESLLAAIDRPVLIGTWASAGWAIAFYEKHGFARVSTEEKNRLLRRYWDIPERQVETSVVLAERRP